MRLARRRTDQGTAAVEFALVFPLLIMLLIGVTTTGMVFFDHSSATNATREAARFGASADATSAGSWSTSVRDRLKQTYFNAANGLTDAQMNDLICVDLLRANSAGVVSTVAGSAWTGSSCGTAPSQPTAMAPGSCVVRVWIRKAERIDLVVFPALNFHIGGSAVSYYGRQVPPPPTANAGSTCTAN